MYPAARWDGGREVSDWFVAAYGDGWERFRFVEDACDLVARLVGLLIGFVLHFSVRLGRYDGLPFGLLEEFEHPFVGVDALVCDLCVGFQLRQQNGGTVQLADLIIGELKAERVAERINGGVNLGAQPGSGSSDGLRLVPLRTPALRSWARTSVESIMAYSLSASLAKCSKTVLQTSRTPIG
jgi:hypothetical protein